MADIALSAIQTVLAALQSAEVKEILSLWSCQSQLEELEETVSTIRDFLLDVDSRNVKLSREQEGYIEKLKDAIYDADDLFDELRTKAQLKQLHKSHKLSKKVHSFFSSDNPILSASITSREVRRITKRLDDIATNHAKFGFKFDSLPIRERREETCSYVYFPSVIGRGDDVEAIVVRLLDHNFEENVSFLTIVGIGGLGKTTLAQLLFNDERVKGVFPLRLWVCVSDQDGNGFEVKAILSKILESAGHKSLDGSSMEMVQNLFQDRLAGKQCLLILDDVWTENCYKWQELKCFLMALGMKSKIIATSRSKETARIIGNGHAHTYELAGLSEANSWILFQLAAFGKENGHVGSPEILEIGKKIVKQCCNVPLAIKVVGSLLFGQEITKWQALQHNGLEKICQSDNMIMSILKFSYDNLDSSSKACFSYCALFPKGYRITKEMLINLWLAQGYVKPFYKGQSLNDAGIEHFSVLLRRCFFQDVKMDEYGEVQSCKIHDFMHDVAQEVAGKDMCVANSKSNYSDVHKVRHIFGGHGNYNYGKNNIRSYVVAHASSFFREFNPRDHHYLRALSLCLGTSDNVPNSLCKLLHLRYLSLSSFSELKILPKHMAKLHNLQTLILTNCSDLLELPNDLSNLVNLRHLNITGCYGLSYMPVGMNKLTCLEVLTDFYVAKCEGSSTQARSVGQLKDLKALKNLKGGIVIRFPQEVYINVNDEENGYLCGMAHLKTVRIIFSREYTLRAFSCSDVHEALMAKLEPHPFIKGILLESYRGRMIPRWGEVGDNWGTLFANLVWIRMYNCMKLQHLPLLCKLQHLRSLQLLCLAKVEYIEDITYIKSTYATVAHVPFFPSLEFLEIKHMRNLKGWWRSMSEHIDKEVVADRSGDIYPQWQLPSFTCLKALKIKACPNLISFPWFPTVETLEFGGLNERFQIITPMSRGSDSNLRKLRKVMVWYVADLRPLPPCNPTSINICISRTEELFRTHGSSSVQHLILSHCGDLSSLSEGGFQHLSALESISQHCSDSIRNDDESDAGIPWRTLHHSLRSVKVSYTLSGELLMTWRVCAD